MSQSSLDSFVESLDNHIEQEVKHVPLTGEVAVYYKNGELNVLGDNESEEVLSDNIRACVRLINYVKRWNSRVYAVKKFNDLIRIHVAKEWKSPNRYPKEFEGVTIMAEIDPSDDVESLVREFEAYNSYMKPVPKEVVEKAVGRAYE
jgi:hypothetical protein